jgi:hypothetical protein
MKKIIIFIIYTLALATFKRGVDKNGILAGLIVIYNPILSGLIILLLRYFTAETSLVSFGIISIFFNVSLAFFIYKHLKKVNIDLKGRYTTISAKKRELSAVFFVLMILLSGFIGFLIAGYSSVF